MALIVEDGTGLEDAESYISVSDFDTYCTKRGLSPGSDENEKEIALRKATTFIDTFCRFKAQRVSAEQALEFPRTGLYDWSGLEVTGVPRRVKDACAELAYRAATGEALYEDKDRGGQIKSESVGPISVTYADGAPAQKMFTIAVNLLKPYMYDTKEITGPFNGTADTDGYFSTGMMENPGLGGTELLAPESDSD